MGSGVDETRTCVDERDRDAIDHKRKTGRASTVPSESGSGHGNRTPTSQNRDVSLVHLPLSIDSGARLPASLATNTSGRLATPIQE